MTLKKKGLILLVACLWYVMGVTGAVHILTEYSDITLKDMPLVVLSGIFGPAAWMGIVLDAIPDGPIVFSERKGG